MENQIKQILTGLPDVRVNRVATLWQVCVGGLSGARENGISLAHDLKGQYEYRKSREAQMPRPAEAYTAEPEPVEIPAFLKEPAHDPRLDLQAARIAELEAALAAAAAPKPEPMTANPPVEIAEFVRVGETYEQTNARLLPLYREAQNMKEMAIDAGDKIARVRWETKIRKIDTTMHWMHGRLIETI